MEVAVHPSAKGRTFRKPICPKGHDKRVVGVIRNYCCAGCDAEYQRNRRRSRRQQEMRKRFCPKGHDKLEVGVMRPTNACAECHRHRQKMLWRKTSVERFGVPMTMVGHDADFPRVAEVRVGLGLSRKQLSSLSGVPYTTLWRIEAGRHKGWPATRKKIVDALASVIAERRRRREKAGI